MIRSSRTATLILLGVVVGCNVVAVCQTPENLRPVAAFHVFSGNESIPASVLLDGTFSADPDGSIVSYQWLFGDGTTGSGAKAEHTYPKIGQYEVTLVVIDNQGASHMITKIVDLSDLERQDEAAAASSGTGRSSPTSVVPSSAPEGSEVRDRAPDFTLPTLDGDIVQLSTYVGHVVLVEFWFRTCSGCISSLPHLEELRSQFEDEGLVILIVVLDHDPAQAEEFFAESEYTAFILAHEHDWSRPTRTAYDVGGTPHVFLIDRSGAIRFSGKPGYLTSEFVASWL
ncbi:PKD domain-containing protein [Candidatus Bipolaricaulota bacterium]